MALTTYQESAGTSPSVLYFSSLSDSTAMSEYRHQHRVLGRGRRVSPTGSITTPTPLNLDRWENLAQSGDDNAAGGGDFMQGSESDDEESGDITEFSRGNVFRQANPTPNDASRNRIPWEQRGSHPPATAITTMMSPSWQSTPAFPRFGENQRMYLELLQYSREFDKQRPPIVENPWGQLSQGDYDVEHTEDEHIFPVADDGGAHRTGRESVTNVGVPSFGFELPLFERGNLAAHSPPSGFVVDDLPPSSEIIPFEEEEMSLS